MKILKPTLTIALLLGAVVCKDAWAQGLDPAVQAYARLPVCSLSADGKRLAVEPCRTAPARVPMPRRPVPQIIQRMPATAPSRQVAMPAMPPSPSPSLPSLLSPPGAPIPVTGCDAGGCYDAAGVRHNNAAGASSITPSGRLCNRAGAWLQCP